nr:DUF3558 domain-containing protein [Mycobacteroides salmoniphilum]
MHARRNAFLAAPLLLLNLSACTPSTGGQGISKLPTSASRPAGTSATTTVSTVPHQPPNAKNNGTTFDPCVAYTPDDLRSVGFDPEKTAGVESALVRGCIFYGAGFRVQIIVLNGTIDRFLRQDLFPGSRPITIDGLGGVTHRDSDGDIRSCYVDLPSQQATVSAIVVVSDAPALTQIPDACTKGVEVATLTAKKLPK